MWILKWLPDWIFHVTLLIGVLGLLSTYLVRFIPIPQIYMYKTPIQLVSILVIVFGTFMSGAIHDNNAWLDRVHEMEQKVAKAEQESKESNDRLNEASKKTKEKIVEKRVVVKEYIDREIVKYDTKFAPGGECAIPKDFIGVINKSAEPVK